MKKQVFSVLAIAMLCLGNQLAAQQSSETSTLIGKNASLNTEKIGFFIAPAYGITAIDGSTASLFYLRGGLSIADKISFGAYFNTSLNQINPQSEIIPNIYMDYWTVGGFAEYTLYSKKLIHFTFPLYLGYGEVQMDNENGDAGLGEANFFQVEPSALLEVNLHKHIRFNLGAGYRFVTNMEYRNFNQADLSGLTAHVGLKFGLFK
jgi:hypothetical protein